KSTLLDPGPLKMFRPALPYACGNGIANADVSNHSLVDRRLPGKSPLPIRFGLQLLPCALMSAQDITTLKGDPLCAAKIPLNCQPASRLVAAPGRRDPKALPRPTGIAHTRLPTKRCVRSKLDSPRSSPGFNGFWGYWPLAAALSVPLLWLSIAFDQVYEV